MSRTYRPPHAQPRDSGLSDAATSRQVNQLLHTLRGEHFRHSQNIRRSRAHLASGSSRMSTTLPVSLIYGGDVDAEPANAVRPAAAQEEVKRVAGPIPRSWVKSRSQHTDVRYTPEWRSNALSLVFSHLPSADTARSCLIQCPSKNGYTTSSQKPAVLPLTIQCLRLVLAEYFDDLEFPEDLIPWISPHMKRDLIRFAAVHLPLGNSKLYQLWGHEGHAAGEMIIIGPYASVRLGAFRRGQPSEAVVNKVEDDWDAPARDAETPLQSLVIVSTPLPVSLISSLPPTLTHVALLDLPPSIQPHIHRLPGICPLLEVLDFSYNTWLAGAGNEKTLDRVEWGRWTRLRVLGMRGCYVDDQFSHRVQKCRWQDVEIVLQ
ncbi:hypothetical protein PUNSTDRAFT_70493 [Punctularia strigosozonata HHB-11173 SS5]|uniref:uncharacterized protein n=1 Tax=Punctularia strigosozonata (strain HHB-11173) TaxID=741275 RepID=UPI0004417E8C|nr:uncharacterized protein PUNSTDRAFT_70493 [Punctularia strigosozonata HHB-11173 SS5]EIN07278.1 hypothetical protein PUNSTDRAFT_70493 [Punctularia strigosozonata HHB-11173 SS5]